MTSTFTPTTLILPWVVLAACGPASADRTIVTGRTPASSPPAPASSLAPSNVVGGAARSSGDAPTGTSGVHGGLGSDSSELFEKDLLNDDVAPPKVRGHVALGKVFGGGNELVVLLSPNEGKPDPDLWLALVQQKTIVSVERDFDPIMGASAHDLGLDRCQTWTVTPRTLPLGKDDGVRVDLVCSTSADAHRDVTATLLLALREKAMELGKTREMKRVWAGASGKSETRLVHCETSVTSDFRLLDDQTLERTIHEETHWTDHSGSGDEEGCKTAKSQRVERIPLPK